MGASAETLLLGPMVAVEDRPVPEFAVPPLLSIPPSLELAGREAIGLNGREKNSLQVEALLQFIYSRAVDPGEELGLAPSQQQQRIE